MARFKGLQLVWLEAFVEVAESRKRTAAAEKMGIHQGTITKHIQHLEQWLGGKMLLDQGVPANLLEDGKAFLDVAKDVLEMLDRARAPHVARETPPPPRVSAKDIKIPALKPASKT